MILFSNNNTKYPQTKEIKILKIKRMWAITEDFIQILSTRMKMNGSAQKHNRPRVWIHNDLHTQTEKMSA